MDNIYITHHVSRAKLDELFCAVCAPAGRYTVIGAKNTLDPYDPSYSPSYINGPFSTREEAEQDAQTCGYPLVEIEEDLDWVAPAWWHVMYGMARS